MITREQLGIYFARQLGRSPLLAYAVQIRVGMLLLVSSFLNLRYL
jgi:hypothetical protein